MRRRSQVIEMDLFPFLSVLVCTIGTLILLIVAMMSQTLSDEKEINIIASSDEGGVNQSKIPRYIECLKNGVIIYPSEVFVPLADLSKPNGALDQLLQEISSKKHQEYLIVAIKPDGIEVFQEVRYLVEKLGIDLGYEPIDEGWKLKIQEQAE
ncbi:MAG: hypothetical protein DSM107014_06955 [Gomphosphaeria aponina SAG 52.96 = DSM 107014]|uniref:Uncharacterized protein n=1 Tax=Gomphosphaeria aponina SAG 52.96 = DSM 107014 TaxID=1521640 RepID=A0A941JRY9_9CHRO|nr:hypothetical protein [Gomphosphaeria aponina SAG 52.96 = DSM 107014]